MEKIDLLWAERRSENWIMTSRYLKLLANSGFMFSIYLIVLVGGYYYQKWVASLPETFPTEWILTVIFTFLVVSSPIRTFLKSADLIFLLPKEEALASYFKKAFNYSMMMQSVLILFIWAVFMPLYLHTVDGQMGVYVIIVILLFALKAWNLNGAWQENHVLESMSYKITRTAVSVVFIFMMLENAPWYFLAALVILMFLLSIYVYHPLAKHHLLKWEVLLETEERQVNRFLQFANLITDVPQMRGRIKPRRWLGPLTNLSGYGRNTVFKRFFSKTFLRSGDYFGIYTRLLVIGAVVIGFAPKGITMIVISVVFIYLTAMQLLGLWSDGVSGGPAALFPINDTMKQRGFLSVLSDVLVIEAVLLAIVGLIFGSPWDMALLSAVVGAAFGMLFTYGYAGGKIRKSSE